MLQTFVFWIGVSSLASYAMAVQQPTTSVTTVFCADTHFEPPLWASVIKANASVTEYSIQCGTRFKDNSFDFCGDTNNNTMILTLGPSTMVATGIDNSFTRGFDCKLHGTTSANCDFFLNGTYALERGHFPYNIPDPEELGDQVANYMVPMTITAGLEKLATVGVNANPASATSQATPKSTSSVNEPTPTAAPALTTTSPAKSLGSALYPETYSMIILGLIGAYASIII